MKKNVKLETAGIANEIILLFQEIKTNSSKQHFRNSILQRFLFFSNSSNITLATEDEFLIIHVY